MILALKTAGDETELYLLAPDCREVRRASWHSGRQLAEELLGRIQESLQKQGADLHSLTGLVVFRGPGSFTSLRIGIATVNALAYALGVPNVGAKGDGWLQTGQEALVKQSSPQIVTPLYDRGPNVTPPKK